MESKLIDYLEELREKGEIDVERREWSFGAIMGAYVMGVITRERRVELVEEYCGVRTKKPPVE